MKKGEIYSGIIETVKFPNKGYVQVGDTTVIVKNGIPGQRVRFMINKKKGKRIEGRLLEVEAPSELQTEEKACPIFPECGGCVYQTMSYESQLQMKMGQVKDLLAPVLQQDAVEFDEVFEQIHSSPLPMRYRNKMEYSFGDDRIDGPLTLGLHKKNSTYDILTAGDCALVPKDFNQIVRFFLEYLGSGNLPYCHRMRHTGFLRHLLVRRAFSTGEILVDLITTTQYEANYCKEQFRAMLDEMKEGLLRLPLEGKIAGFLHTENDSLADVVQNDHTDIIYGNDYFFERILDLDFKITPFSFFQTNSKGAEVLYSVAREFLGSVDGQTVFDLYSGTGTIAQILAPAAKKVIGVEIVEEATKAAVENAARNELTNCEFIAGDVLKVLDEIEAKPDVIVLDPPRDGIHPKALPKLIAYGVETILYISCKPTSLARDLEVFQQGGYHVKRLACVDMFPMVGHVECIALIQRVKS